MPTPIEQLSEKQRQVLELHNKDMNPTEIGKALGITSQAVHGHFRRLRDHGYDTGTTQPGRAAARARKATPPNATPPNGVPYDAHSALAMIQQTAAEGIALAENRKDEIDTEIDALRAEKKELDGKITELRKHLPASAQEG